MREDTACERGVERVVLRDEEKGAAGEVRGSVQKKSSYSTKEAAQGHKIKPLKSQFPPTKK